MIEEEEVDDSPKVRSSNVRSGLVSQRVKMYETPLTARARKLVPRPSDDTIPVTSNSKTGHAGNDFSRSDRFQSMFSSSPVTVESRHTEASTSTSMERQSVEDPAMASSPRAVAPTRTPASPVSTTSQYRSSPVPSARLRDRSSPRSSPVSRASPVSRNSPVSPRPRDSFAPTTAEEEAMMASMRATPKSSGATQRRMKTPSPRPSSRNGPRSSSRASHGSSTQKSVTPGAPFQGCSLIESGVRSYSEGDYERALKAFTAALKTQRANGGGDDDIGVALTLGNLGSVYLQQNNLFDAEKVLLESLDIKRRLSPEMVVADTLNNLGNCMNLRGELEASLIYYEDALTDIRQKNGRKTDEINAYFNIGRLEIQRKHWTKAMLALNEACKLAKETYSTNHAFVAQTLDLMGFVQLSTMKLDAAMVSFTGALAIYRRLYGPMHLEVANSLFNVGMVREAKGENTDAWEAYTTARDLYSRIGTNKDHPGFTAVRRSIAKVEKSIQGMQKHGSSSKQSKKGVATTRITVQAK